MGKKDMSKIDDMPVIPKGPTPADTEAAYNPDSLPNVIFVGKVESKGETVDAIPPKNIQDGRDKITLPDADAQLAGFYHKDAARIIKAMPKAYKAFKPKGAK